MCRYKRFRIPLQRVSRLVIALMVLVGFSSPASSFSQESRQHLYPAWSSAAFGEPDHRLPIYVVKNKARPGQTYDNLTPEDRARMQRQYQEWQSLPPNQKDAMRRRMDELKRMPPQERNLYQQRYQQWQQLSPDERRQLENNLRRWDSLSPQERDSIRRRFKN
jgi:hypothetical protein